MGFFPIPIVCILYLEVNSEPDGYLLVKVGVRRHQHIWRVKVGVVENETTLKEKYTLFWGSSRNI